MYIHISTHWLAMYMLLHTVINHMIEDGLPSNETVINSASCVVRPTEQQTSVISITPMTSCSVQVLPTTVTRRVLIPILTTSIITRISSVTITTTPQSSCSCSDQQQTSASSSSSDPDAVTICIPIVVVFGVIILLVLIITGILIWRKTKNRSPSLPYNKAATIAVENDLYGLVH